MDYENKHKEEIIRATHLCECGKITRENLEYIFPELKESDDERIRKSIIAIINNYVDNPNTFKPKMLAWLEKQGTQKPIDKVEPKFKVGDWAVENEPNNYARFIQVLEVVNVYGKERYKISRDLHNDEDVVECRFIENNYHSFTIQEAKDGDVLCYKDEIFIYKHDIKNCTEKETSFGGMVYYCCYDGKRFITDSMYSLTERDKDDIHPATKEQRDLLFSKMKEAGYEWDVKKKELKRIEQVDCFDAEPKESKDEMIRKGITKSILNLNSDWLELCGVTKEDALVWLENQGEQKAILDELEMTLSVSEDGYLRENIEKLIKKLKTNKQQ